MRKICRIDMSGNKGKSKTVLNGEVLETKDSKKLSGWNWNAPHECWNGGDINKGGEIGRDWTINCSIKHKAETK